MQNVRTAIAAIALLGSTLLVGCKDGRQGDPEQPSLNVVTSRVSVTPSSVSIAPAETISVRARFAFRLRRPALAQSAYAWSSSNPAVATVSSAGLVTGIASGSAVITASYSGNAASAQVTVTGSGAPPATQAPIASLVITPATVSLAPGASQAFAASGRRAGDTTSVPVSVTWSATGGTIAANGDYVAGTTTGTSFSVTATLVDNTAVTTQAAVTVAAGAPPAGTPPTVPPLSGAPGVWTSVTPGNVNLTSSMGCGNYGVSSVQVDPNRRTVFYAHFDCQGIWRSDDAGVTWRGPINTGSNGATVADCAGGVTLAPNGTSNPPILLLACMRGAGIGFWRSLDGGVNWTRYTVAPAPSNRQDFYPPSVDPYDPQHLIMVGHEQDVLAQSVNGGQTWTSIPLAAGMRQGAGTGGLFFVNTGNAATTRSTWLWLAQATGGSYGTWRTTSSGATWTQVERNEHTHGSMQVYQSPSGELYMPGVYSPLGWGVLRSTDLGVTWAHVGARMNQSVVFGTPNYVYGSYGYPSGLGTSAGPSFQRAPQRGVSGWATPATPAGMRQGAAQAAVGFDGTRYVIVTANWGAGLWRYVETVDGPQVPPTAPPVTPPVVPPTSPSPTPPAPVPPAPPAPLPPAPAPPAPQAPPAAPPGTAQNWTFCSNVGPYCEFDGARRDVRLVASNGAQITQTAFQWIGCNDGFFTQNLPAGASGVRCDYGPRQTEVVPNPMPGMAGLMAANITVPLGDWGETASLVRTASNAPGSLVGEGNFRTVCNVAKFGSFDPIVYPGQAVAGHLHMFFGNTGVNPNSTVNSIATTGASTCAGGSANRTAYWIPAVFDAATQEIQVPRVGVIYYKSHILDPTTLRPIPAGLRMIAGDKNSTRRQDHISWNCGRVWNQQAAVDGMIPNCAVGDEVVFSVAFPECWDGVNLDSPDHKSHMAYAIYRTPPARSTCPTTHPVPLPQISENFFFPVTSTSQPLRWRLSSDMYSSSIRGGLSGHADWMDGWNRDIMNAMVRGCINGQKDCTLALGDGRELYYRR